MTTTTNVAADFEAAGAQRLIAAMKVDAETRAAFARDLEQLLREHQDHLTLDTPPEAMAAWLIGQIDEAEHLILQRDTARHLREVASDAMSADANLADAQAKLMAHLKEPLLPNERVSLTQCLISVIAERSHAAGR